MPLLNQSQESGWGIDTTQPQPADATLTNPWPVAPALVQAILREVQTRFRLLAMDNLQPALTEDEIGCALRDSIDTVNNHPPATKFTIDQLFFPQSDPRFRQVFYLAVAQALINTLLFSWSSNGFDQSYGEFDVKNRLDDYHRLQTVITEQLDSKLEKLKKASQKYILAVLPRNQSMIRPYGGWLFNRPLNGSSSGWDYGGFW